MLTNLAKLPHEKDCINKGGIVVRISVHGHWSTWWIIYFCCNYIQPYTSAKCYTAPLIQLFSCWRSRRILSTNSYSCLSLLLVSHKQCRMNLIGPSEMLQNVKDQSDSFYISYMRQVARTNKNMSLLAEFSWIFSMKTAESLVQYET